VARHLDPQSEEFAHTLRRAHPRRPERKLHGRRALVGRAHPHGWQMAQDSWRRCDHAGHVSTKKPMDTRDDQFCKGDARNYRGDETARTECQYFAVVNGQTQTTKTCGSEFEEGDD
jgi:hypothetical protein